jgi:hypothetical protein
MNIKEVWNVWRGSTPPAKDMRGAFERACTPAACHGVLIELESATQKIATLEAEILAMREAKEEDDLNAKEEGIRNEL